MAGSEREPITKRIVELSKGIDKTTIAVGSGIWILFSASVGAILVIGSLMTYIPASAIGRYIDKKRGVKK